MAQVLSMRRKNKSVAEIAKKVDCSERTVFRYLDPDYQSDTLRKKQSALREEAAAASRKRCRQDAESSSSSYKEEAVQVTVGDRKVNLHVRRGSSDVTLLDEIFKKKFYAPKTLFARSFVSDPRLNWHLMDVGGNIGAAAIFLMNHIEGRLRSVDFIEPEMSNMTLAKKNLRGSTAGCGFTFHQAALVGNERIYDGKIKFSVANSKYNRYRHCLTEYQVVADATHERVAAIRFSTLLREVAQPALFLKLDCEGPERHILTILAKAMNQGRMPDCTRMVLVIAGYLGTTLAGALMSTENG